MQMHRPHCQHSIALDRGLISGKAGLLPERRFKGASSGIWTFTHHHFPALLYSSR